MSVSVASTTVLLEDILVESASLAASNAPGYSTLSTNNPNYATPALLGATFVSQPEASIAEQVFRFYEGMLGHAPDASGMQTYVAQAEAGLTGSQIEVGATSVAGSTWSTIVTELMATTEYAARFPVFSGSGITSIEQTVFNVYGQILDRQPNSTELAYYTNLLNTGTTINQLLQYFLNSPEYINDTKSQIDASLLNAGLTDVQNNSSATHHYTEIAFGHSSSDAVAVVGIAHGAPLHA